MEKKRKENKLRVMISEQPQCVLSHTFEDTSISNGLLFDCDGGGGGGGEGVGTPPPPAAGEVCRLGNRVLVGSGGLDNVLARLFGNVEYR